jgi:hypothetical protein
MAKSKKPVTITDHEMSEVARANKTGKQPVLFVHGLWLLPDLLRDYCDFWKGLVGRRTIYPSEQA